MILLKKLSYTYVYVVVSLMMIILTDKNKCIHNIYLLKRTLKLPIKYLHI